MRSVLRDHYGRSSRRLLWSDDREQDVLESDRPDNDRRIGVGVAPPTTAVGREPELAEWAHRGAEDDVPETPAEQEPEEHELPPPMPAAGWRIGGDPLATTRRGTAPDPTTVRSRVWKNQAEGDVWDDNNRDRLRAGKSPRRRNPLTGRSEHATVDTGTGIAAWPDSGIDPFEQVDE